MIGKYLIKLRTKFALKRNDAIRVSDGYQSAQKIGILYNIGNRTQENLIKDFVQKLKSDGKKVKNLVFVSKAKKKDEFAFSFFTESDFKPSGKWKKPEVEEFKLTPFDYLVSLDWETNKYTRNILAGAKAKCRVGRYEENFSQYYELMLQHNDDNFEAYLDQLYHYLKNMRNG